MDNVVIVVGAFAALIFLLLFLYGALALLERVSPRFRRYVESLDRSQDRGF